MTVTVKMHEKSSSFSCGGSEVNGKHPAARLQNPSYLAGALLASFARQMMQHQCAQDDVELILWKRQRLGGRIRENDLDAGLSRILVRPRQHLR